MTTTAAAWQPLDRLLRDVADDRSRDPVGDGVTLLELLAARPDWHADAACVDAGLDVFFPGRGESPAPARQMCAGCPVRDECLEYALAVPGDDPVGIWGGTSARERRPMRRQWVSANGPRERRQAPAERRDELLCIWCGASFGARAGQRFCTKACNRAERYSRLGR